MQYRGFTIQKTSEPWAIMFNMGVEYFRGVTPDDSLKMVETEKEAMDAIDEILEKEADRSAQVPDYVN